MNVERHDKTSEYREHSQKSRSSEKTTDEETSRKTVHQTVDRDTHPGNSEIKNILKTHGKSKPEWT